MDAQDLRKLLEQANDRLSIFASPETLNKYTFNSQEFFGLINDFLSDEEKLKLFDYPHFRKFDSWIKSEIIKLISDENILLQIMNDGSIIDGFTSSQVVDIIIKMEDVGKQQLLNKQDFIEKYQIPNYGLEYIISSLTEKAKTEILMDKDLITDKLHLTDFQIVALVEKLPSEDAKDKLIELYQFENYEKADILKTCSDRHKLETLLKDNSFHKSNITDILQTLDNKSLSEFLVEHKEFFYEKGILPYEIVHNLDDEQQKEFVSNLENINLTVTEKKEILATLKPEIKESIDISNFPEEYKLALSIQTEELF